MIGPEQDLIMAVIIIESVGFSATHSVAEFFQMSGNNQVSHGTKNFTRKKPIGEHDLSFENFHQQMINENDKCANSIAVHSLFSPDVITNVIDGTDTQFFSLMRKQQFKQIMSCFYWAIYGFVNGREDFAQIFNMFQNKQGALLKQKGLPVNMQSCLMLYAFDHVATYNLRLLQHAPRVLFMEDFIAKPTLCAELMGVTTSANSQLKVNKGPSHRDKVKDFKFLSESEEMLRKILKHFLIKSERGLITLEDLEQIAEKKSIIR